MENDERRQKLIVMQSSLDRATHIIMSMTTPMLGKPTEVFTLENVKQRIKETAVDLYNFVFDTVDGKTVKNEVPIQTNDIPTPTLQQAELLKKMNDYLLNKQFDLKVQDIEHIVWSKYQSYPKTTEMAKKMISELLEVK